MTLAFISATLAWIVGTVLVLGWLIYLLVNWRQGRAEIGSEIELAPNRKPYLSDEELEGKKLERTQLFGLGLLVIIAIGLPLYWLQEPGRQAGAVTYWDKKLAGWGASDFATTAEGGFNCAGCHGGMTAGGGVAPFTVTDPTTGEVKSVNWTAPALNTVLYRFSEDEVRYILVYGRPFSPMSPWGTAGGGPMNDQQIGNLINYIKSIQLPQEGCPKEQPFCNGSGAPINTAYTDEVQKEAEAAVADGTYKSLGEALFNLGYAGGSASCARCHTKGWSYGDPQQSGGGAMGPNLTGGSTVRQFPNIDDQISFIKAGSENGKKYGMQGQGSGRMPGFDSLLTDDQIAAIVDYERGL
jgi:mono/diheme cytochrome c family protein